MTTFHDIKQGSIEWHELRDKSITATDIYTIMGINEYKSPYVLWAEKLGIRDKEPENEAMRRGKDLESEALAKYCELTGKLMYPVVATHEVYKWAMASLDAISQDHLSICEIKCMGEKNHKEAMNGDVKPLYNYQMQWQMFVTDTQECDYFVYSPESWKILTVKRDQDLINQMIPKAEEFLKYLKTITPPPFTELDYMDRRNEDYLTTLLDHYKSAVNDLKSMEKSVDHLKNTIINYCNKQNTLAANGKITRVTTKGRVKYDTIPELEGVDLEKYRGEDITSYRITTN